MNHIFVLGYKIKFDSIVGKYTIKSKKSFGWSHYDEIQDAIDAVEKHFFSLPQNHSAPEMLAVLKEYVYAKELHDPSEVEEMRMAVRTKDYRKSANVLFMALEVIAKAEGG